MNHRSKSVRRGSFDTLSVTIELLEKRTLLSSSGNNTLAPAMHIDTGEPKMPNFVIVQGPANPPVPSAPPAPIVPPTPLPANLRLLSPDSPELQPGANVEWKLVVIQQPTNSTAGGMVSPVKLVVEDGNGNVNPFPSAVNLGIASGPAGAVLSSTTETFDPNSPAAPYTVFAMPDANGVITFKGLSLNLPGTYTLQAADSTPMTSVLTLSFEVSPATENAAATTPFHSPGTPAKPVFATGSNPAAEITFQLFNDGKNTDLLG